MKPLDIEAIKRLVKAQRDGYALTPVSSDTLLVEKLIAEVERLRASLESRSVSREATGVVSVEDLRGIRNLLDAERIYSSIKEIDRLILKARREGVST